MPEKPVVAYLTSLYARASDTFIRGEVAQLRRLGHVVHTFSIRRPAATEIVGEDVRRERAATEDVLHTGLFRLIGSCFRELGRSPRRFAVAFSQALRLGTPGFKGRLMPMAYLVEACWLAGRLRDRGVQHLHNHLGRNSAAVALLASTLAEIPYSMTVHGPTEFDEPRALALGLKIAGSKFTVAISDYGRSQLCRWSDPSDWSRIHVVHCGVGLEFLDEPPGPPDMNNRLLCVGRLAEQKGHLVLVEAAEILRRRGLDFEIAIVGDGPGRGRLVREIAARNLDGRVRLLGWKSSGEVRDELARSRALVMPSFAEGLPVVLMESLALGRPVVATYVAGIPELVRPGLEGWLVPAGSVELMADAMAEALASDVETLAAMGRSGADRVAERHHPAVEAAKLSELIGGGPITTDRPDPAPIAATATASVS